MTAMVQHLSTCRHHIPHRESKRCEGPRSACSVSRCVPRASAILQLMLAEEIQAALTWADTLADGSSPERTFI